MKKLKSLLNAKNITRILGAGIGILALYFSLKNIQSNELARSLKSMSLVWLLPIIIINFGVIALKALRWQIMVNPVKKIGFPTMFRILTIGFMANSVLPARMGEAVRIHMLGKDASVSRITTTATVIADRIIEAISFLIMAALLTFFNGVPEWLHLGLIVTLAITAALYLLAIIYSGRKFKNHFLQKLQDGIKGLLNIRLTLTSTGISLCSWLLQGIMLYMTQLAFGVELPVWGIILVLLAINLAIALPSAPGHIGTFEFACILAYTYLGLDKGIALLIGITFHLMQLIPVTLVGGLMMLAAHLGTQKPQPRPSADPGGLR